MMSNFRIRSTRFLESKPTLFGFTPLELTGLVVLMSALSTAMPDRPVVLALILGASAALTGIECAALSPISFVMGQPREFPNFFTPERELLHVSPFKSGLASGNAACFGPSGKGKSMTLASLFAYILEETPNSVIVLDNGHGFDNFMRAYGGQTFEMASMEATPLDPGFFTSFAWATFAQFREVGIGLVVVLTLIALLVELISVHQGGGMESGGILVRAATAIVLLSCFQSVIEGAKDFVWSIEKVVSSAGSIEQTLDRFSQLAESGPFWAGHMGRIQLMFAGWGMTLAHYFSDFIFWLYGVLWLCATISAPILIPTLVMEATQKIFRLFLFFVLALLFARIPWAMVSAVLGHLVEYLSTHGKGEELRAFFLFWIALVVTAVTPLVSTIAFFKLDGVVRAATQTMKFVGQAASGAINAGATVAGRAAWSAQQYVHVMHGKEMMTGDMAKAFESRFGAYRKPPTLGQADLESAEKRSRDYYKPRPT